MSLKELRLQCRAQGLPYSNKKKEDLLHLLHGTTPDNITTTYQDFDISDESRPDAMDLSALTPSIDTKGLWVQGICGKPGARWVTLLAQGRDGMIFSDEYIVVKVCSSIKMAVNEAKWLHTLNTLRPSTCPTVYYHMNYCVVMDYVGKTTLIEYCQRLKTTRTRAPDSINYQLIDILHMLYTHKITTQDPNRRNILISNDRVYFIDLAKCKKLKTPSTDAMFLLSTTPLFDTMFPLVALFIKDLVPDAIIDRQRATDSLTLSIYKA
jgi:predicted Ser/Thr protein kinase